MEIAGVKKSTVVWILVILIVLLVLGRWLLELFWAFAVAFCVLLLLIVVFGDVVISVDTGSEDVEQKLRRCVHQTLQPIGRAIIRTPNEGYFEVSVYDEKDAPKWSMYDWSELHFSDTGQLLNQGKDTSINFNFLPSVKRRKIVFVIPSPDAENFDFEAVQDDIVLLAGHLQKSAEILQ